MAKRRAKAARIHGASRDAEAGPTMSESDLMGSGSIDEFKARCGVGFVVPPTWAQ